MNTKKFTHPKEELLAEGRRILSDDAYAKFVFRVSMVNLMLSGMRASELSELCGVNKRTLTGWVDKVDKQGYESLMAIKQSGRPSKLSKKQEEEIRFLLEESDPEKYGYAVWDGRSICDFIWRNMGVEYTPRACQNLLHRLNYNKVDSTLPQIGNTDNTE